MTRENGSVGGHRQPIKLHADPTPGGCDRSSPTSSWPPGSRSASGWVERSQSGLALRGPADNLASAGGSIRDNMSGAARNVGGVPLVGGLAARALRCRLPRRPEHRQRRDVPGNDGRPGLQPRRRGRGCRPDPGGPGGMGRGPDRIRFVRRATAAQRWMGRPGALELFAVRALSRQPLRRLERVGWTQPEGSAAVTGRRLRALADLELDRRGLA